MNRFNVIVVGLVMIIMVSSSLMAGENESIRVLQNKVYPLNMKFQLSGGGGMSVADRYSQAIPFGGEVMFHPLDFLSIGGFFLYTKSSETSLLKKLNEKNQSPPEPERTRTKWLTGGELAIYPIYGKFSILSEIAFNYHIYLSGGGGVGNIVVTDLDRTEKSYGTQPVYTISGGAQIHLLRFGEQKNKYLDLKVEGRYFGYTVKSKQDVSNQPSNSSEADISNSAQHRLVLSMLYLSFLF